MSEGSYTALVGFAGLVVGFFLSVLLEHLKQPTIKVTEASKVPFTIDRTVPAIPQNISRVFNAYRVRVENTQRRYLNAAAENCVAWLQLDSCPEPLQLSWVGDLTDVSINVGDHREVDFMARELGTDDGAIVAPTERGYFSPEPRRISTGDGELRGKIRITCKNGKRAEKRFSIKPRGGLLEIVLD